MRARHQGGPCAAVRQAGMTLLEIMIVLAILGSLMASHRAQAPQGLEDARIKKPILLNQYESALIFWRTQHADADCPATLDELHAGAWPTCAVDEWGRPLSTLPGRDGSPGRSTRRAPTAATARRTTCGRAARAPVARRVAARPRPGGIQARRPRRRPRRIPWPSSRKAPRSSRSRTSPAPRCRSPTSAAGRRRLLLPARRHARLHQERAVPRLLQKLRARGVVVLGVSRTSRRPREVRVKYRLRSRSSPTREAHARGYGAFGEKVLYARRRGVIRSTV